MEAQSAAAAESQSQLDDTVQPQMVAESDEPQEEEEDIIEKEQPLD